MKKTTTLLCSLLMPAALLADWVKLDDFNDSTTLSSSWRYDLRDVPAQAPGTLTVVSDPFNDGQGNVLSIYPGIAGDPASYNTTAQFALPSNLAIKDPVTSSQPVTFYFKVGRPTVDGAPGEVDVTFGLAAESAKAAPADVFSYGNYSVLARYEINGIMDVHSAGYKDLTTAALNTNVYYEIWYVVDHFNNTFDMYVKGGTDFPTQTLIFDNAVYRNQTLNDLTHFLIITSAGDTSAGAKGKDPTYFDDLYIDISGQNLTTPGSGSGGGNGGGSGGSLAALATRANVGAGDNVAIGGLVISGGGKKVLIRAVGAELTAAGVAAAQLLSDPVLQVLNLSAGGTVVATIDNWDGGTAAVTAEITATGTAVGAFPPLTAGSKSAAVVLDLADGIYGVIVSGAGGATGIANVEVYGVN